MPDFISIALILTYCKIAGSVVSVSTLAFGVFRVISWIKAKFISIDANVVELKNSMDTNMSGLREDIKHQTNTLATELREQRQDFRTFYAPTLLHMMNKAQEPVPVPVRAKRPARKKSTKKG